MTLIEWFDTNNIEHLKAYNHLQNMGAWPQNFIPNNIEFESGWRIQLWAKLADEFIKMKISQNVEMNEIKKDLERILNILNGNN